MISVIFSDNVNRRKWSYDNVRFLELKNGHTVVIHGFDYVLNHNYQIIQDLEECDFMTLEILENENEKD